MMRPLDQPHSAPRKSASTRANSAPVQVNNPFRQVGIATGIAALGAIFQSQIASSLAGLNTVGISYPTAQGVASGFVNVGDTAERTAAHTAFISGLNTILLVAAFVLFTGAILAFVLVRQQDFVESGAEAAAASG